MSPDGKRSKPETLHSPDGHVSVTVSVGDQEADGVYPIFVERVTPSGQAFAIEYNGKREFQGPATA
jgi:hypothetical protein